MSDERSLPPVLDPDVLELAKRHAARYTPRFRLGEILAHNTSPSIAQHAFAFGDPGTEAGHTLGGVNGDLTVNEDGNGNHAFFLRFELEQSVSNHDQNQTRTYKLQYRRTPDGGSAGAWTDVTASSSHVQVVADSNIADGAATTNRISGGAASIEVFQAGEYDEGNGTLDSITWAAGRSHTELLFSLQVVDADMGAGDVLDFRIVESSGTLLDAYTVADASLTWAAAAGASLVEVIDETEGVAETSAQPRGLSRIRDEAVALLESSSRARVMARVRSEVVGIAEGVARKRAIVRERAEAMWILEAGGSVAGAITAVVPDPLGITEGVARARGLARAVDEVLGISEGTARARTLVRAIAESLGIPETVSRARSLVRSIDETLGLSELVVDVLSGTGGALVRVVDEAVALSESVARSRAIVRIRSDATGLLEGRVSVRSLVRERSELVHVLEVGGSVEGRIVAIMNETQRLLEAALDVVGSAGGALVRVVNELLHILEDEDGLPATALVRWVNEALHINETSLSSLIQGGIVRVVNEAVALSESLLRRRSLVRDRSELIHVVEAGGSVEGRIVAIVYGALGIIETVVDKLTAISGALVRVVNESISVSEVLHRARAMVRVRSEVLAVLETSVSSFVGALVRVVGEVIGLTEGATSSRAMVRVRSSVVAVVESVSRTRSLVRSVIETIGLAESVVRVLAPVLGALVRVVSETVAMGESVSRARTLVRVRTSLLGIVEKVARSRALVRVRNEALSILELAFSTAVFPLSPALRHMFGPDRFRRYFRHDNHDRYHGEG